MLVVLERDEDFQRWEGKLTGRIVLTQRPTTVAALFTPPAERHSEQQLRDFDVQPIPPSRSVTTPPDPAQRPSEPEVPFNTRRMRFLAREGVLAVIEPGTGRADHGAVLVAGASANRDAKEPAVPPQVVLAAESYNRLARLLMRNQRVALELNVENRFLDDTLDTFNVIAEIPGTDRADEVVMLGAHLDSWHTGTGATDNAAGSAVMMEAVRILRKVGLPMRRTVRMALWTGEEQGLLGSTAYVREHFADRDTMVLKPAHAKLAAYFNMDNGTGAIRGVYLQGNEGVRPIFETWMQPLRSLGMTTLTIRSTEGTDHMAFDRVGLPGFQFVQDWIEYRTYSHHTNMDVFDRLQSEDLMKNAVIVASFVYHAANRDALLPRKPLPAPRTPPGTATK
jgi:Iap family predicted aminopeptidase